jgi:hypothetical protein
VVLLLGKNNYQPGIKALPALHLYSEIFSSNKLQIELPVWYPPARLSSR